MDSLEKQKILEEYCSKEMKKLKQVCYPQICKIGGISAVDHDDLYSIALSVLWNSLERFNDSQDCKFSTFLNCNIQKKFDTYVRDRNRAKRSNTKIDEHRNVIFVPNISIDETLEDGAHLCEKIDSGFCIENELAEEMGGHLMQEFRST